MAANSICELSWRRRGVARSKAFVRFAPGDSSGVFTDVIKAAADVDLFDISAVGIAR